MTVIYRVLSISLIAVLAGCSANSSKAADCGTVFRSVAMETGHGRTQTGPSREASDRLVDQLIKVNAACFKS